MPECTKPHPVLEAKLARVREVLDEIHRRQFNRSDMAIDAMIRWIQDSILSEDSDIMQELAIWRATDA